MKRGHKLVILLLFTVLGALCFAPKAKASTPETPWLDGPPTFTKLGDLSLGAPIPSPFDRNIDCRVRNLKIIPARIYPLQKEFSVDTCMITTAFGDVGYDKLQRPGTDIGGSVTSFSLQGIPGTNTGYRSVGQAFGVKMYFYSNLDEHIESRALYDGQVEHTITEESTGTLKRQDGGVYNADPNSTSFSSNGDWMFTSLIQSGLARVNTRDYSIMLIDGQIAPYGIGIDPNYKTAISPDGRYVAIADGRFAMFRLYDLNTCQDRAEGDDMNGRCRYLNLWPLLNQQAPGLAGINGVRFKGDNTLEFYSGSKPDGNSVIRSHFLVSAAGFSDPGFEYMGIGDSFASGEGAYQYKATTDVKNNKCHLSERSYPLLIAKRLNFSQFNSVACSGAKIKDIVTTDKDYIGQVHDGVKQKDRDTDSIYSNFEVGKLPQRKFIENYQPKIVTMSVGGNDIGFSDKIVRCLSPDTCYDTYEERLGAVNEVNAQFDRLVGMYTDVKNTGDPRAKVYVIGYPQVGDEDGNCADNVHLNHGELAFTRQYVHYLNSVVHTAADNAGVYYVDVENAFEGHKLCQTDSWNTAVNGLTAGNDIADIPLVHGPIGNESFHPNALGHELLETKILDQTSNLTAVMPAPDLTKKLLPLSGDEEILQRPHSNNPIKNAWFYPGVKEGQASRSEPIVASYNGKELALKGSSPVQMVLTSDPVLLGEFTTDVKGNLETSVIIPDTVPSGFHTLHLYAKNIIDEDVDVYQTIFVSSSDNPNKCKIVADSGKDVDQDGIDDACDGFIDKAPVVVTPPPAPIPAPPTKPTIHNLFRVLFALIFRLLRALSKGLFFRF